jgi:hypothetical protein
VRLILCGLLLSGCFVATDGYGLQGCKTAEDCPDVGGYLCVSSTTWPQRTCGPSEEGCLCEVSFPAAPADAGYVDAGPPPDYCTEVKPIFVLNCVGTCHGPQMGFPNSPSTFRLDYYAPHDTLPDGGSGLPGIKAMALRVQDRIFAEKTMPPPPDQFPIQPTDSDRALVNKWIKMGYPYGSGTCETPAPAKDGGTSDGGAPVSFATDIVPIFAMNCACHTSATPSAGLSLTAGNAYTQLVNANVSSGCTTGPQKRVVGNAPSQSQLWLKASDDPQKCGNFMPRSAASALKVSNPAAFDKIERWIRQGAPNN